MSLNLPTNCDVIHYLLCLDMVWFNVLISTGRTVEVTFREVWVTPPEQWEVLEAGK